MIVPSLILAASLGAVPVAAGCLDDGVDPARVRLLVEINRDRSEAGLEPLELDANLCRVAQERAEDLAAAGSPEPRWESLAGVSRRLFRLGYEAHRWEQHAILGSGDLLATWRSQGDGEYRRAVLGDFQQAGIGVAASGDLALYTFLLALPKREQLRRETAPLGDLEGVRRAVLARVNAERRARGRPPLAPDPLLDRAAQAHARDMLERAYYDHASPEGVRVRGRVRATGYRARRLGENLAKGLFSPEEVVERWLGSSGHRHNLLSPAFEEIGVGLAFGDNARGFEVIWVQVFAEPWV